MRETNSEKYVPMECITLSLLEKQNNERRDDCHVEVDDKGRINEIRRDGKLSAETEDHRDGYNSVESVYSHVRLLKYVPGR